MLQSLSIKPTHPVIHERRQESPCAANPGVEIEAIVDAKKPLTATLSVFVAGLNPTAAASPIASRLVDTASLANAEGSAVTDRTPSFMIHTDLSALRKLRSKLDKCVTAHSRHCSQCHVVAHYLSVCWDRPRLLHRSWDGAATLQTEPLAGFLNQLLQFACQLNTGGSAVDDGDDAHQEFVRILISFLRPSH